MEVIYGNFFSVFVCVCSGESVSILRAGLTLNIVLPAYAKSTLLGNMRIIFRHLYIRGGEQVRLRDFDFRRK